MNLPPTDLHPPFNITRASHLVLTSRDLAKARDFYTEVIGLKVSDETATTIHFRGVEERAHHCLTLKRTKEEPACERVGLRVFEEEDLEKAKAHFDAKGMAAKFVNVSFQGRTLHVSDVAGTPLELCARMKTGSRQHTRAHEHTGAGALRLDHMQVCWCRMSRQRRRSMPSWDFACRTTTAPASESLRRSCTARTIRTTSC